jgi:hypothetical protein
MKEAGIGYNLAAKSKAAGGIREQAFEAPVVQFGTHGLRRGGDHRGGCLVAAR